MVDTGQMNGQMGIQTLADELTNAAHWLHLYFGHRISLSALSSSLPGHLTRAQAPSGGDRSGQWQGVGAGAAPTPFPGSLPWGPEAAPARSPRREDLPAPCQCPAAAPPADSLRLFEKTPVLSFATPPIPRPFTPRVKGLCQASRQCPEGSPAPRHTAERSCRTPGVGGRLAQREHPVKEQSASSFAAPGTSGTESWRLC